MPNAMPSTVISHWSHLIESFQASPLEFYQLVEVAIQNRQIPDIQISRVLFKALLSKLAFWKTDLDSIWRAVR